MSQNDDDRNDRSQQEQQQEQPEEQDDQQLRRAKDSQYWFHSRFSAGVTSASALNEATSSQVHFPVSDRSEFRSEFELDLIIGGKYGCCASYPGWFGYMRLIHHMNAPDDSTIRSAKHPFLYCYGLTDRIQYMIEHDGSFPCYFGPVTPAAGYYSLLLRRMALNPQTGELDEAAMDLFNKKYESQIKMEVEWWRDHEDYAIANAAGFVLGFSSGSEDEKLKKLVDVVRQADKPCVIIEMDVAAPLFLNDPSILRVGYDELKEAQRMQKLHEFLRERVPWIVKRVEVEPPAQEEHEFQSELRRDEPPPAAAVVHPKIAKKNPELAQSIAVYQLWYSIAGLILGSLCVLGGIALFLNGVAGKTSWTAKALDLETNLTDAAPGTILFVVGLFIVFVTRFKYTIGKQ